MNEEIFRKKTLDKVKSPDNLDDYIQVSNPGVWLLLASIIILLVGACVWGVFGHIDSTVVTEVRAEDGTLTGYVSEADAVSVKAGMTVRFEDYEADVAKIGRKEGSGYLLELQTDARIPDGIYSGRIVTGSVRPLSFVLN